MSRGFVKEGDQEEIPILTPRAHLPDGVTNYVTQVGMDELLDEKQMLINNKAHLDVTDENERRIALNHINAKLQLLNDRILTAKIVDLGNQSQDEIWFGASVTLKEDNEARLRQYQIVGVDEADVSIGKISFISPIAKMLLSKKVGDEVVLQLPNGDRIFEVIEIVYEHNTAQSRHKG